MIYLYAFLIVAALAASLHIILSRKPLSPGKVPAICLIHLLFWVVGLGGILAFGTTLGRGPLELAGAYLAIGVVALVSLWIKGPFFLAPVIFVSVFRLVSAFAHGPTLVLDILIPVLLIACTALLWWRGGRDLQLMQ